MLDRIFFIINELKKWVAAFCVWNKKATSDVAAYASNKTIPEENCTNANVVVKRFKCVGVRFDNKEAGILKNYILASNDEKDMLNCSATPLQDVGPHHLT